jgi:hypothetical protein
MLRLHRRYAQWGEQVTSHYLFFLPAFLAYFLGALCALGGSMLNVFVLVVHLTNDKRLTANTYIRSSPKKGLRIAKLRQIQLPQKCKVL